MPFFDALCASPVQYSMAHFRKIAGVFAVLAVCVLPSAAQAQPRCGGVDNGIVDDAWDMADDLSFYRDYRSAIESTCDAMEALEDFERDNKLSKAQNDVLEDRAELLAETVEEQLADMEGALKAIKVWLRADADSKRQRLSKIVNIGEARDRAQRIAESLGRSRQEALALMKT